MMRPTPEQPERRGNALPAQARRDGIPDRLFALAWARLADAVAPPDAVRHDRVLVLRAVSLYGGG